jgi:hypothetical protein
VNQRPWIFISGPYSDAKPRVQMDNCAFALSYAELIWENGGAALCPHYNSYLLDYCTEHAQFVKAYKRLLGFCDGVLMLPKWTDSKGARQEHTEAQRLCKPTLYLDGGNVDIVGWIKELKRNEYC